MDKHNFRYNDALKYWLWLEFGERYIATDEGKGFDRK